MKYFFRRSDPVASRRIPNSLVFLPMFVLAAALSAPAQGQDDYFSRWCKQHDTGKKEIEIPEGSYDGKWSVGIVFKGPNAITQTIKGEGIFRLIVDRRPESKSKFDGFLTTHTNMSMPEIPATGQDLVGSARMELVGKYVESSSFKIGGDHHISGQIHAPGLSAAQSFSDHLDFTFEALEADCMHAKGTVKSVHLDGMKNDMIKAGFTAEPMPFEWEMTRGADYSDVINKFREELNRQAPAGIVRTRSKEAERLGKLADRYSEKYKDLWEKCLSQEWMVHCKKNTESWVKEDTTRLSSYKGDWPGLQALVKQAMDTASSFALLGLDWCEEATNEKLFKAVDARLSAHLEQEIKGQCPPQRLLADLQQSDLLGRAAPELRDKVMKEVQRQAEAAADDTYNYLVKVYKVAKAKYPKDPLNDPNLETALRKALVAEACADLVGLSIDRASNFFAGK